MPKPKILLLSLSRRKPQPSKDLDYINELLAEAAREDALKEESQSEFEREAALDMVSINVPSPDRDEVITRLVHPDVKALIDELLHTITTHKHNLIYLQREINSLIEERE